jgi:hypothetical protein
LRSDGLNNFFERPLGNPNGYDCLPKEPDMIAPIKRAAVASLTVLTLSIVTLATPVSAANDTWRDDHQGDHWRGGPGRAGAALAPPYWQGGYGPGGLYRGKGANANNWCAPGESMYNGC